MWRGGGDNDLAWPTAIRSAAHPEHELRHLHFFRNRCNICRGAMAGMLGYRCEACDFDVHCGCLLEHRRTQPRGAVQVRPMPYPHHRPPPPRPRPSSWSYASLLRPNLHFTVPYNFNTMQHQHGSQTSSVATPAPANYPAPQYSSGYYGSGAELEPGAPASYSHLQQQQDYQTTNNRGGYMDDSTGAYDIGDVDDYYDVMDDDYAF